MDVVYDFNFHLKKLLCGNSVANTCDITVRCITMMASSFCLVKWLMKMVV